MATDMAFYDNAIKYLSGFLCALYRVRLVGGENIPREEGFLLCANHTGAMDPFIIGAAIRVKVYWMAKEELFRVPLVSGIIRAFGAVPIKRGAGDIGALRKSIELLSDGKSVGIFPQGHRNPGVDPRGTALHNGTGMIAGRAEAPILPVAIENKGRKLSIFRRNYIVVGPLIPYEDLPHAENAKENHALVTEHVFDKICTLWEENRAARSEKEN